MKWFQHDSNASSDSKIRKLLLRYGPEGYAVYFHCLELIAAEVKPKKITFELEHDAEIIADNLNFKGNNDFSAIDRVNNIMKYIVDLNLFQENHDKIVCLKLALRLDNTTSRSPEINIIKHKLFGDNKEHTKMLQSNNEEPTEKHSSRIDENTIHNIKTDKTKIKLKKKKYGEYNNVLLTDKEYANLEKIFSNRDEWIKNLDEGIELKGYKYKSHYLAIIKWAQKNHNNNSIRSEKNTTKNYAEGWEMEAPLWTK
jgi:hypothetical protein